MSYKTLQISLNAKKHYKCQVDYAKQDLELISLTNVLTSADTNNKENTILFPGLSK